jgi:hypothetical protein
MYKDEPAVLQYAQGKAPYSVPPHHRFDASCRSRTRVDLYIRTYCKTRNFQIQIQIPLSYPIYDSNQTPTLIIAMQTRAITPNLQTQDQSACQPSYLP